MYVQRDQNGKIIGRYANPQEGYAEEYLADELDVPDHTDVIKQQILALEASQYMTRGEREAWLAQCKQVAAAQGLTDAQAIAVNPFYAKLVDQNNAVVALRALLK